MATTKDKPKNATKPRSTPKPKETVPPTEPTVAATPTPSEVLPSVGDVDVADVKAGSGKGELGPVILEGFWVRLGKFKGVDDRYVGHIAQVLRSPWAAAPVGVPHSGIAGYTYDEKDTNFIVRTRDDANALVEVPQEAFTEWGQARVDLTPHG